MRSFPDPFDLAFAFDSRCADAGRRRAARSVLAVAALFLALGFNYGTWGLAPAPPSRARWGLGHVRSSAWLLLCAAFGLGGSSFPGHGPFALRRFGSRGAAPGRRPRCCRAMLMALAVVPNWGRRLRRHLRVRHRCQHHGRPPSMRRAVELERAAGRPVISRIARGVQPGAPWAGAVFRVPASRR